MFVFIDLRFKTLGALLTARGGRSTNGNDRGCEVGNIGGRRAAKESEGEDCARRWCHFGAIPTSIHLWLVQLSRV